VVGKHGRQHHVVVHNEDLLGRHASLGMVAK